jgi:CubicO group peptidase (beta-lactamase class C family)
MTSGIYDFANDNDSFDDSLFSDLTRLWTPEEILTSLVGKPNSSPGDTFGYSNTNYIILGMIIKEATGSMVSVELRNRFLDPMDLNRTHLAGEEILIGETAHPWNGWTGVLEDYSFINDTANFSLLWTMGGMFSTARDVAQWAQALYGGAVLNQEYLDQMVTFTPIDDPISPPEWTGYGLGTFQFNILDRELWGHAGIWYGYVAIVAYLPIDGISIAVLLNENYWGTYPVLMRNVHDILAVLLGSVLDWKTGIADESENIPVDYTLKQNYPNPFNPSTTIEFTLPKSEYVELKVYNILGKEVATLVSSKLNQGNHTYQFDGKNLASGVYYYQLVAGNFREVKKMILLR